MDLASIVHDEEEPTEMDNLKRNSEDNEKNTHKTDKDDKQEIILEMKTRRMIYKVEENPPLYLTIFFALQQCLVALPWSLTISIMTSELVCARHDEGFKARLLSTTFLLAGFCTLMQNTIGIRLPIFQGPTTAYIIPLLTLASLPEWHCPAHTQSLASRSNGTNTSAAMDHQQHIEDIRNNIVLPRMEMFTGALMLAGGIHMLLGMTGTLGILLRYIGPLTIVPTITLSIIAIYKTIVKLSETHWGVSAATAIISLILSLYLERYEMPFPSYSRETGWHLTRLPLQQVFSVLIAMICGWVLSTILTVTGVLSDDNKSDQYFARTDARLYIIKDNPWFNFPYPGQFGSIRFNLGVFGGYLVSTFVSVIDSIADYYACAKMINSPPPPVHAMNRGIMVEGFATFIAGVYGAGHATSTYGTCIGVLGITKVASRSVFLTFAIILIVFSFLGKLGAAFITIPYPILGGIQITSLGVLLGIILATLQYVDLKSTRNLAVVGISILLGLMVPYWITGHSHVINTGNEQFDGLVRMLLSNMNFVGGAFACLLDNVLPGTEEERGMLAWNFDAMMDGDPDVLDDYDESPNIYEMSWLTSKLSRLKFLKHLPFYPTYKRKDNLFRCRKKKKGK